MNSLLLSLAAVLILVLSALFAAPLFIDWNEYRPAFEAQASKLLGREVKVGGKVHLVLLPAPELRFDNVTVAGEHGRLDKPLLEAKSLAAWLSIGPLLTGTVVAHKIVISNPTLRLTLNADGSGNWSDVGGPGESLPFVPKDVMLDSVKITSGRIEIFKQGAPVLVVDNVDGELSAASLAGPYKAKVAYDYAGRRQEVRFSTGIRGADGVFRLKLALRDPDRATSYIFDGEATGLGAVPSYHGAVIMRVAGAASAPPGTTTELETGDEEPAPDAQPVAQGATSLELKGELNATPNHAELPAFDLTVYAKGRPQILKGKLAVDFGEERKVEGELSARWVDLDALLAAMQAPKAGAPDGSLRTLAETALDQAAALGRGSFAVTIEQATIGGDLVGGLDLKFLTSDAGITLREAEAILPGDTRFEASGRLFRGKTGPVFAGPIRLESSKPQTFFRWAVGNRDISAQGSAGDFTFAADAIIGDEELRLDHATGELSGTRFSGTLHYRGGKKRTIELVIDSDRLDLREIVGEDLAWRSWLPSSAGTEASTAMVGASNLLVGLRDDELRVVLRVGELLLPNIPGGRLDADFTLVNDTLDVVKLDFAASGALALTGQGRIEHLSEAPSGRVDFTLKAETADALRVASGLFGFPESVAKSKQLASLAPLDVGIGLVAAKADSAVKASLTLNGKAGGSDVTLTASAVGKLAKLGEAEIDIDGSVVGERPLSLLSLLLPELPQDRLGGTGPGKLTIKVRGVPETKLIGRAQLATSSLKLAFDGRGALRDSGVELAGKLSVQSPNAGLVLILLGLEPAPSAAATALDLRANLTKAGQIVELQAIAGEIAGEPLQASARFDLGADKTRFTAEASAPYMSLSALLGSLVAWKRTPWTEELLGTISQDAADVWPARGFALGVLSKAEGDITLKAGTLALGSPFLVEDATVVAEIGKDGLAITSLTGRLFGGSLAASGILSPRGSGAALSAKAKLTAGKLELFSQSVAGSVLVKGPFTFDFDVSGEGLSPPGLVADLSGEGTLALQPGMVQALTSEPLRRVALEAAKTKIKADKTQAAALARSVRQTLKSGTYDYEATTIPFEVRNGMLTLTPATLASQGVETAINLYVELASLRLDSEWVMRLQGAAADVPPVSLVFAGPLSKAGQIAAIIDTGAIESYLTVRRMEEDVERLENLDVSGRSLPGADDEPASPPEAKPQPVPVPDRAPAMPPAEARPLPRAPPAPQPLPGATAEEPRAADLEQEEMAPRSDPAPQPALQSDLEPASPQAPTAEAQPQLDPAAASSVPAAPRAQSPPPPRPMPDDWKKGISIFGGF